MRKKSQKFGGKSVLKDPAKESKQVKYIVVTGGVISGLGKGITASSMGRLLKCCGIEVTAIKIDPYLNCDAGTMNPFEHGEVYVLDDGAEADLDLGNYERFLDLKLGRDNNITTGKVYRNVIEKERRGEYLGKTVQIIPHITGEIERWIMEVADASGAEVCIIEVGGTVGDIESMPFLEAVRELAFTVGRDNIMFVHTTLIPVMGVVGEQKTKPTQHSVKELMAIGIEPDMIVGRSEMAMDDSTKRKISLFCNVPVEAVVSAPDARTTYEVPLTLHDQGVTDYLLDRLDLGKRECNLDEWKRLVSSMLEPSKKVDIAVIGKYTDLADSYLSILESFRHAGASLDAKVNVVWVEAEDFEDEPGRVAEVLDGVDGVLIPGGFGSRGTDGKMHAIKYARENDIPLLGICYGFQLAVIEFARNVAGLKDAHTTEIDPDSPYPVVNILPEQAGVEEMGGTMRLGAYPADLEEGSIAAGLYGSTTISERHRHRYEVNPEYIERIEAAGLKFTGRSPDKIRMEVAELPGQSFFVASQYHPEFNSRPNNPSPLFKGLVEAALKKRS